MRPPLREVMTVIRDGLQVPGMSFYALLGEEALERDVAFPSGGWPEATEHSVPMLRGEGWHVLIWDVALPVWPLMESFKSAVATTFAAMLSAGSVVTWIGREGYFCDPPQLFLPECMSGGVLAAESADGKTWIDLDPDAPLSALPDSVLMELRLASTGLSDAGSS